MCLGQSHYFLRFQKFKGAIENFYVGRLGFLRVYNTKTFKGGRLLALSKLLVARHSLDARSKILENTIVRFPLD
jgi:hypothetical protein